MLKKSLLYIIVFLLSAYLAYVLFGRMHGLADSFVSDLRIITTICTTFFSGLILFVKTALKDLVKLDKLRSTEIKLVGEFTQFCTDRIWRQISFYALVFLYGLIISFYPFESFHLKIINLSIIIGLLAIEVLTLLSTYSIDRSIVRFNSYITFRAKKIDEKENAIKELEKDQTFSSTDMEHFVKRHNVIK